MKNSSQPDSIRLMPYPVNLDNIVSYSDQISFSKTYKRSRKVKSDLFSFDNVYIYDTNTGRNIQEQHANGALNSMTYGELATLLDVTFDLHPLI